MLWISSSERRAACAAPRPARKSDSVSFAERDPFAALRASVKARLRKRAPPTWVDTHGQAFFVEGWLFEPKLDGVRSLVFRRSRGLQLGTSRSIASHSSKGVAIGALLGGHRALQSISAARCPSR
jgi:hypothetical protein